MDWIFKRIRKRFIFANIFVTFVAFAISRKQGPIIFRLTFASGSFVKLRRDFCFLLEVIGYFGLKMC